MTRRSVTHRPEQEFLVALPAEDRRRKDAEGPPAERLDGRDDGVADLAPDRFVAEVHRFIAGAAS